MKKSLSWQVLLLLGVIVIIIGRTIGGVIGQIINVLGDILFLLGVVNMISTMLKKRKAENNSLPPNSEK